MKKGSAARLKQPEIRGEVIDRRVNTDTDEIECLLSYTQDGEPHQVWFAAEKLEAVAAEGATQ